MGFGGSLVRALIDGRRAQTQGKAIGQQERAAAEAAAAKAEAERQQALEKMLLERQRVELEGSRVDNDTRRVGLESSRSERDADKFAYEQTQRPTGERLTQSIINRNNRQPRGGGGGGSAGGAKPLTESQSRTGRNEFVRDLVRSEALQRNLDLSKATPEQRKTLAALAMERVNGSPALLEKAKRYGVTYTDYMSEAGGGRGAGSDAMGALANVLAGLQQDK